MKELFNLYQAGKIKPQISATFPLSQGGNALEALESRSVLGKVVVTMDSV